MTQQTESVEWLQDVIVGADFIVKQLEYAHGADFEEATRPQINEFLADTKMLSKHSKLELLRKRK